MDYITITNREDFGILAELRWGASSLRTIGIGPKGQGRLECSGIAVTFDVDIRTEDGGWIAKATHVYRNSHLHVTHHPTEHGIVYDLLLD